MESLVVIALQAVATATLLIGAGLCLWHRCVRPRMDKADRAREASFPCIEANDFEPNFRSRLRTHLRRQRAG